MHEEETRVCRADVFYILLNADTDRVAAATVAANYTGRDIVLSCLFFFYNNGKRKKKTKKPTQIKLSSMLPALFTEK